MKKKIAHDFPESAVEYQESQVLKELTTELCPNLLQLYEAFESA